MFSTGVEAMLATTDVKGFPIVSPDGKNMLGGYIGRTELRYVLGKAAAPRFLGRGMMWRRDVERFRKMQDLDPDTPCIFISDERELERLDLAAGPSIGIEGDFSDRIFDRTSSNDGLKFWPWVNQVRSVS